MKNKLTLFTLLLTGSLTYAQTMGTMTDNRDGKTYKTVTYQMKLVGGGYPMTWMAENLNYTMEGSWCYSNISAYCKGLGRLYTWGAAMKACPSGWHLPSDEEWNLLINKYGGEDEAGKSLKSTTDWENDGNGTNSSGFNGMPAGNIFDGSFVSIGEYGSFWSSSEESGYNVWGRYLRYFNSKVYRDKFGKEDGSSCRCLREKTRNTEAFAIKDSLLRSFVEGFSEKNSFPIIVDKELFDSSRVIPDEFVKKYIKGNFTRYYYGTRFPLPVYESVYGQESVYGLIYHYLDRYVPEQIWIPGVEIVGSNILFLNTEGEEMGKISNVYYEENGFNEVGEEYERNNLTSIMKEGDFFQSKSEKTKEVNDGVLINYEEIKSSTYYYWNGSKKVFETEPRKKLVKGETTIKDHASIEINPTARKAVLDTLSEIKDISFIGVIKQNDEYFRINANCVAASKLKIINTSEELKNSGIPYIDDYKRYLPIWVDENSEYFNLITNPGYDKSTGEYSFTLKSFEVWRDDYPVIKLNQEGYEIRIVRSDDGYWMVKPEPAGYDRFAIEEKIALTLPISDYSCEQ